MKTGSAVWLITCLWVTTGCVTRHSHQLDRSITNEQLETQIFVVNEQDTLQAEFIISDAASSTMKGGLVWVLADVLADVPRRQAQAEAVQPIQAALAARDLNRELAAALQAGLAKQAWLGITSSQVVATSSADRIQHALNAGKAVLLVKNAFRLTPSLRTLRIDSSVELYSRDRALSRYASPGRGEVDNAFLIYGNRFLHQHTLVGVEKDQKRAAAAWLENDGERLLEALDTGMKKQAQRVVFDLEYIAPRGR